MRTSQPMASSWHIKRFGIVLAGAAFFLTEYHLVAMMTAGRHVQLMSELDRAIPLIPWTAWLYAPLYAAGIIATGFMLRDERLFLRAIVAVGIGQTINSVFYVALPSAYPRAEAFTGVPTEGVSMAILRWVHSIDPPHNTFPSAHVMVAFLCAMLAWRSGHRGRWFPVLTGLGIAIAVTTTKQHYIVDSLAGIAVAWTALRAADWWMDRRGGRLERTERSA